MKKSYVIEIIKKINLAQKLHRNTLKASFNAPESNLTMKTVLISFAFAICSMIATSANAAVIGVSGARHSSISSFLTSQGHTVVDYGNASAPFAAASYAGLDAYVLERVDGSAALADFVTNGGTLVTEWTGADWALNTANLLDADISGGGFVGSATPITFTAAGIDAGLATGLSNPYSDSGATQYFRNIINIGADVEILATRPSNVPVIIGGASGAGNVVIMSHDWADGFPAVSQQLLLNALNVDFNADPVPAPGALALLGLGILGLATRRRMTA